MTVYAITDTKKRRTGIAPTYLQKTTTTRNSTVCLCIFSRSAFYPTFRSTFPHAEFRILHVRDFMHSAIRILPVPHIYCNILTLRFGCDLSSALLPSSISHPQYHEHKKPAIIKRSMPQRRLKK